MEPRIHYAVSSDGVRIAVHSLGRGRPCVILPTGWLTSGQVYWQIPDTRMNLERLAAERRVVQYDGRGYGLSDREVTDFSLDARLGDLTAVVESLDSAKVDLVAIAQAGPTAISFAARHPERVSRLILADTVARGRDVIRAERQRALRGALEVDWELWVRTQVILLFDWTELGRKVAEHAVGEVAPDVFLAGMRAARNDDVTDSLAELSCPTLVMQARGGQIVTLGTSRHLAASIPGARFSMYENTHPLVLGENRAVDAIEAFLAEGDAEKSRAEPAAAGEFRTILFTDIEGSTLLTQRLGDARAQDVLRSHNAVVREALAAHWGSEIKHTGDGIMASFGSASRALDCAVAIQRALAQPSPSSGFGRIDVEGMRVRIGLNAGEPVAEDADLFGTAVQLAARVCAQAEPGQILVPNVVRELAAGKGFLFSDRGDIALRGFEDPVRLYEVRWSD